MKFTAENMGKVKIPMIYKKDAALRRKWFNARKNGMIQKVKNGVIKKVKELGKLISAKVLLLMQNTEKDDILCVTSRDENSVKKCLSKAGFKGKLEYELIPNPVENSHDNDACFAAASDVNGYKGCPLVHLLLSLLGFHPVLHLQPPAHPYHAPVYCQDRALYTAYISNSSGVSTVGTAAGQFQNMLVGTEQIQTFAEPPKSVGVAADCVTPAAEQKLDSNSEWFRKEVESTNILGGKASISVEDADLNNSSYDNVSAFTEEELEQLFAGDLESTLSLVYL